jgi:hypothetical protein
MCVRRWSGLCHLFVSLTPIERSQSHGGVSLVKARRDGGGSDDGNEDRGQLFELMLVRYWLTFNR